ncbi:MAG TPA: hypothetical protein VK327_15610 [Candidatus Paceibacterota bacterium]|nr:hypothetical protein [Candidatus Paceibacterota bacterium]
MAIAVVVCAAEIEEEPALVLASERVAETVVLAATFVAGASAF